MIRHITRAVVRSYGSNCNVKTMQAWQALRYGDLDVLQLNPSAAIPVITRPDDVLVKVRAASVNPLDVMMLRGYGASVISTLRCVFNFTLHSMAFPLILGRDFSGEVVASGSFNKGFKAGDEVFGVVGPQQPGSHAEFVKTSAFCLSKKPSDTSHVEAASIPYAGLTAWSALSTFGGLTKSSTYGRRVLVLGASGGVGTFAVQLLKAWGADVTAVCATDAVEMVQNLGADFAIDYLASDITSELKHMQKFDFILDTVGGKNYLVYLNILKPWQNSKYVTTVSPLLQNADDHGFVFGNIKSFMDASCDTMKGLQNGHSVRWAYFIPNGYALKTLSRLVENKQIVPVIDKVYSFNDAIEAYEDMMDGHARGKTVIDFSDSKIEQEASRVESKMEQCSEAEQQFENTKDTESVK